MAKKENEIVVITPITNMTEQELEQKFFAEVKVKTDDWLEKAKGLVVTSEDQVDLIEQSAEVKKVIKNIRGQISNIHKEQKEESLKTGQKLDSIKRRLMGMIEPVEEIIDNNINFVEVQEEKRKDKLKVERTGVLVSLGMNRVEIEKMALGDLNETVFNAIVEGEKARQEKVKVDAQKAKEENDRLAKEATEAKAARERDRKRAEQIMGLGFTWKLHPFDANAPSATGEYINEFGGLRLIIEVKDIKESSDKEWDTVIESVTPGLEKIKSMKWDAKIQSDKDQIELDALRIKNETAEKQKKEQELQEKKMKTGRNKSRMQTYLSWVAEKVGQGSPVFTDDAPKEIIELAASFEVKLRKLISDAESKLNDL